MIGEKNQEKNIQPFLVRDNMTKPFFGFSTSTARRLADAGILKRRKIGGVSGYIYDESIAALKKHAE